MSDALLTDFPGIIRPDLKVISLIELLRARAESEAERKLYTFLPDGPTPETSLTYAELDLRARSIAAWLQSAGAAGERVLLLFPPGLDYVAAFFGCLYAKAVAVPAYPPSRNRNLDRLRAIVEDARPKLALTTQATMSQIEARLNETTDLKVLLWRGIDAIDNRWAEEWQPPDVDQGTLAFLQYTSGSTSQPKGVMITHGNLLHNEKAIQSAFRQTRESVIIGWLPLFHDMGLIGNVLQPLYVAAECILLSPMSFLQNPSRWLETISRYRGTTSGGPNFAYDLCVRKSTPEQRAALDLSCWTTAFNGSEPVRKETIDRFCATFEPCGFRRESFFPCYGLAEATLYVSGGPANAKPVVRPFERSALEQNRAVPIVDGTANARSLVSCGDVQPMQIRIVDQTALTDCAPGGVGEIWVSGESVAQGYWNRPLETEHTFRAHLADGSDGPYLRTGDLGFLADDHLFITGRLKDLIIIRGRNCYPQDIEQTVGQCDAALRPGEGAAFSAEISGEERLIVVHEIHRGYRGDNLTAVIDNIRKAIAEEYELQVYAVALLKPGTLLRTSSGKTQRQAMKQAFLQGTLDVLLQWQVSNVSPAAVETGSPDALITGLREMQEWIAIRVAAVLGLSRSQIDVAHPLISYGLDSLAAVELAHNIEEKFDVSLRSISFMQEASVSEITARVSTELLASSTESRDDLLQVSGPHSSFALSHGQAALWFLYQLAPQSAAYNVTGAARIRGDIDKPALQRAFQTLVDRHPALRVTFESRDGDPVQVLHDDVQVAFREVEATGWSNEELNRRISEEAHRPFDLRNGPLFVVTLFNLGDEEHLMLLNAHHIIIDMWSLSVLVKELNAVYEAERSGRPHKLTPLTINYEHYVRHQEQLLAGPSGDKLREYWRRQFSGELPLLNLPADFPRPLIQTYEGTSQSLKIDLDTFEKLTELARRNFTTLYTVLLTAYLILLYRHTGQDELIVGSPTSGRTDRQFQPVVGYFVNLLAIRARLEPDLTFQQFLTQVRETVRKAFEHQEYPFPLLVGDVCPDRDPSRTPVFQTTFVFEKAPLFSDPSLTAFALGETDAGIDFNSLRLESVSIEQQIAQFDLSLFVGPVEDGLAVSLQYNTDLFNSTTIERMLGHFKMLVDGIVAQPEQQISEIPLLTEDERDDLSRFNDTKRTYPAARYLHEMFEAQAETIPDAVALVSEGASLTYRELNHAANRLAHYLRSLGVGPEVPVAVFLNRTPELVVSLLAVLKAGGAYVPLDPQYPRDRVAFMLEDTGASVLICREELVSRLPKHTATLVNLDRQAATIAEQSHLNPRVPLKAENLSHVIYTSGSTGRPKGVAIEHRSVINFLHWANSSFSPEELAGVVASTSICFDLSVFEIFAPLSFGGTVILVDDALHLATHAAAEQATLINTVPSAMAELLRLKAVGAGVRTVNLAGEALKSNLVQQIYEETTVERVLNLYGPTEYTTYTTGQELERDDKRQPTIGRPIANTQVHIVDQKLQPVPIGVVGEVCAGGQGLARGYLNRPDLTAERFIPDGPGNVKGRRIYRTGDLGQLSGNGEIQYVGRRDHQVKLRGYRIELGEIESALLRYPEIKEAVVVVREDVRGDKQMLAYIVLEPGETVSVNELRDYLRTTLPVYMVPQFFVTLDALPLTSNGKVDRRALPSPETTTLLEDSDVTPRDELEEIVAGVWCEVLGLAHVGSRENFFDVGGQSLKAVQVVSRLSSFFQIELPLKIVFEAPTVQSLATLIAQHVTPQTAVVPIERVPRDRHLPLSFAQQRLWFLHGLDPQSAAYNISFSACIVESFNLSAWEQSLSEILRRHEILRTTFAQEDGRPVQVVTPYRVASLRMIDLRSLPERAREEVAQRLVTEETCRSFDLEQGPLFRSSVLRLGEDSYILLISMHHIVCDGWSAGLFIRELMVHYEAFSTAQPSTLAELNLQYADFAAWQRQPLQVERAEPLISYWKKQLSGAPAVLDLPQARPRPAVRSHHGGVLRFDLPSELRDRLVALGRSEGATLFMTLLASFQLLLWRYSGQTDLLVGTPVANRSRAELEQLIGCFVNTIVMRTDLSGDPTFRELLARVREVAIGAYMHQEVPFERVVSELTTERDLSRTPIYQVVLVLQNTPFEELRLGSGRVQTQESNTGTAKFDMTLQFTETQRGLEGRWEYSTDLFDEASIQLMAAHLQTLLEGIVENPERHISELPILSATERRQLLAKYSEKPEQETPPHCLHELFEQQVALAPEATALVFGDECLSYAQLNAKANQLAHYLVALGLQPEARVGILLERSPDMVVAMLAVVKAGGAYVPLDPTYPAQRIDYILKDCDATLLLTHEQVAQTLLSSVSIPVIRIDRDSEEIAGQSRENVQTQATKANLAYVIYTSGSSGQPKGVLVTHENVTRLFASTQQSFKFTERDVWTFFHSFAFDFSVWEIWGALLFGGRLVIVPYWISRSPDRFYDLLCREQVTVLNQTPSAFYQLADYETSAQPVADLALRLVIFGGEALEFQSLRPWIEQHGDQQPQLVNMYGITETTVHVTYWPISKEDVLDGAGSIIGDSLSDLRLYVLDQRMELVPVGVAGELYVGGPGLARGYMNHGDWTAERFVPDPFSSKPDQRLYKTGDLGRCLPSGAFEYLGRSDEQVKIQGFRIELSEIETTLAAHPGVRAAAVVAREDDSGRKYLVAYIAGPDAANITQLRAHLQSRLPRYMVPAVFVPLERFPLTPNGKIDRKALPEPVREIDSREYVAARTRTEKVLADIWGQVLQVEHVGIHDNFFDLGGDSILSIHVVASARRAGLNVTPQQLFQQQTIAKLALVVSPLETEETSLRDEIASHEEVYPLTPLQQGMLFHILESPGSGTYLNQQRYTLAGDLSVAAFQSAFQNVVDRHEVLRTAFVFSGQSNPQQVVSSHVKLDWQEYDWRDLAPGERVRRLEALLQQDREQNFDLTQPPLIRFTLIRLETALYEFVWTFHLLLLDGWSIPVLLNEVLTFYGGLRCGKPVQLDPPVRYGDYIDWLQKQSQIEAEAYYRSALTGFTSPTSLGEDRIWEEVSEEERFAEKTLLLDEATTNSLRAFSTTNKLTLNSLVQGAWALMLSRRSGSNDVCFGAVVSGRPADFRDVDSAVGNFLNTLPVRVRVHADSLLLAWLQALQAQQTEARKFEFCSLVDIHGWSDVPRNEPLFESVLIFQNIPIDSNAAETQGLKLVNFSSTERTNYPLTLVVVPGEQLLFKIVYKCSRFEDGTISRILDNLQRSLVEMVSNSEAPLSALSTNTEAEKRTLIDSFNQSLATL